MQKIATKVAQAGILALIGYEVGEHSAKQVQVIPHEIVSQVHKEIEPKSSEREYFFVIIGLLIVIAFAALIRALKIVKLNRRESVLPIVAPQGN